MTYVPRFFNRMFGKFQISIDRFYQTQYTSIILLWSYQITRLTFALVLFSPVRISLCLPALSIPYLLLTCTNSPPSTIFCFKTCSANRSISALVCFRSIQFSFLFSPSTLALIRSVESSRSRCSAILHVKFFVFSISA